MVSPKSNDKIPKYQENQDELSLGVEMIILGYEKMLRVLREQSVIQNMGAYGLSSQIVVEIVSRVLKDKARFTYFHDGIQVPDSSKVGGYLAYWIAKLRPIYYPDQNAQLNRRETALNQLLAVTVGLSRTNQQSYDIRLDKALLSEWLYTLNYRVTSGDDLSLLFKLIIIEHEKNNGTVEI